MGLAKNMLLGPPQKPEQHSRLQDDLELFTVAYFFGPECLSKNVSPEPFEGSDELDEDGLLKGQGSGFKSSIATFEWVKRQLEAGYPGNRVVISKELVPWLNGRFDLLPKGYRHMFLIRNPYKMFPSWKKLNKEILEVFHNVNVSLEDLILDELPPAMVPPGLTYKESNDLWQHIKDNNLDPDPIIIDSDELLRKPKEALSAVCAKLGIPYSDSMLSWEPGLKVVDNWVACSETKYMMKNSGFFDNFRSSKCFRKPKDTKIPDLDTFSPDLQRCIEYSMPYYKQMFENRLKF